MKSLKSRLRRQDAPGPTSSGAAAAASAVSPAARARPGSLRSLPAESPSARKRALLPWLLSAPGSAAAATPPPSGRGSAFAWRPWGPSPPPPPGLAGPLPRPFPPGLGAPGSEIKSLLPQSDVPRLCPSTFPANSGACPAPHECSVPAWLRGGRGVRPSVPRAAGGAGSSRPASRSGTLDLL